MNSAGNEVLLLFPNMHQHTPVAANIWGRNFARALALSGIKPTILYLGQRSQKRVDLNGVCFLTLPVQSAWFMGVPKLRSLLLPILQRHYILRSKGKYRMIVPLEGPYTLNRELHKCGWVKASGSKYFFTILEHPKRNAAARNAAEYETYMVEVANMYDIVMTITDYIKDIFIDYGRTKPTLVNPIIVDTERFDKSIFKERHLPIRNFLYCGNLNHEEEMCILFREFAEVAKEYPAAKLVVIGGGRSLNNTNRLVSTYQSMCNSHGVQNSVRFLGTLLHDEVVNEYRKAKGDANQF